MSGNNFTKDISKPRVALGDLTNHLAKRDFSSISVDLGPRSKISHKVFVTGDENLRLAKQPSQTKIGGSYGDDKGLSVEEDKQESDSSATDTDIDISQINLFLSCQIGQLTMDVLILVLVLTCLKPAIVHFARKDIKGRLAALKKSQKEASMLADKYTRGKQTEIHSLGNSNKSSNLESDLTAQWKSLFHCMEDVFLHESNQLQAGYVALKDLRENCRKDLERTTGGTSNNF